MKDIGEKLRLAREKSGISIDEASEDLNYKVSQLEDIETGNYRTFKDKFILKTLISDYAKYLGLDVEEVIDEFNDFVFESTSKIPIDEIAKNSKEKIDTDDKIASPYTAIEEDKKGMKIIFIILIILLIIAVIFFLYNQFFVEKSSSSFDVSFLGEWLVWKKQ